MAYNLKKFMASKTVPLLARVGWGADRPLRRNWLTVPWKLPQASTKTGQRVIIGFLGKDGDCVMEALRSATQRFTGSADKAAGLQASTRDTLCCERRLERWC